jgi:6,7-dimethyl-8-ribityllumazine synthase
VIESVENEVVGMPNVVLEGSLIAGEDRAAIVVSRFNDLITERLLAGAVESLHRHGLADDRIIVVRVPGAFELPLAAQRLARSGQFTMVICLGAVIQGETTHHEYINHQMAAGILQASLSTNVPVTFGVLTCQSMDQAFDRAGGKAGNKGVEAALAAIEMANLTRVMQANGL